MSLVVTLLRCIWCVDGVCHNVDRASRSAHTCPRAYLSPPTYTQPPPPPQTIRHSIQKYVPPHHIIIIVPTHDATHGTAPHPHRSYTDPYTNTNGRVGNNRTSTMLCGVCVFCFVGLPPSLPPSLPPHITLHLTPHTSHLTLLRSCLIPPHTTPTPRPFRLASGGCARRQRGQHLSGASSGVCRVGSRLVVVVVVVVVGGGVV